MSDLSGLSDADLLKLYGGGSSPAPQPTPLPLTSMSDDDLLKLHAAASAPASERSSWDNFKTGLGAVIGNPSLLGQVGPGRIVAPAISGLTLPGDVATGQVDPMSDEAIGRPAELASIAGPVGTAIKAGDRAIPGAMTAMTRDAVAAPTADALRAAASAGYDSARNLGVDYSSEAVSNAAAVLRSNLEKDGILAELAPKSFQILGKFSDPPSGSVVPLSSLEAARRAFGNAAKDYSNPTEQLAAKRITDGLDTFVSKADPATVVAGPATDAAKVLADARGNYAAAMRSDKINGIEDAADLRAAAANSGANGDNAIRQRVVSLLQSPKQVAGYSEPEVDALREVATGTPVRNTARVIGNLLGGGGGLGAAVTGMAGGMAGASAGGSLGAVAGAALPLVGVGAKQVANSMTRGALNAADDLVRTRSPLYEQLLAGAPMSTISPEKRAALTRALLLTQPNN